MQTSYPQTMTPMLAGQILDARPAVVESPAALSSIAFGRGVTTANASDTVRTPTRNTATLTGSGPLVASNVVNGKVNGVALTATTYASSHAATMAVIAGKIDAELLAQGITAVTTVSTNNLITVAEDANVALTEFVVTLGAGQITYAATYTTADAFRGVAAFIQKEPDSSGVAQYEATETVSCVRRGLVAVTVAGVVTADTDAYCVLATSGKEGQFTATSTGNIGPVGKFRSAAADGALAKLELNMP